MKLTLDGEPEEFRHRATDLVKALAEQLDAVGIDLGEELRKANPHRNNLRHRTLRELHDRTRYVYGQHLENMIQDVMAVLEPTDTPTKKAEPEPVTNDLSKSLLAVEDTLHDALELSFDDATRDHRSLAEVGAKEFFGYYTDVETGRTFLDRNLTLSTERACPAFSKLAQWLDDVGGQVMPAGYDYADGTPIMWVKFPADQLDQLDAFEATFGGTRVELPGSWYLATALTVRDLVDRLGA